MSVRIMARVWAHSQQKGGELLVMLALADFANDAGECWPSVPTIAQKARLTERQTQRVINTLESAGEVQRNRSNGGRNRRNRYLITVPENPDKITVTKLQGKNNTEICDAETLTPMSPALNRHRTVNMAARKKRRATHNTDPRIKTLIDAFHARYVAKVGSKPVIGAKDAASLKRLLTAGHDVPMIEAAMERYFADEFYSKTGFDAAVFAGAFNRLNSAGTKQRRNFEDGQFPELNAS